MPDPTIDLGSVTGQMYDQMLGPTSALPGLPDLTAGLNVPQMQYGQYTGDISHDSIIAESNAMMANTWGGANSYGLSGAGQGINDAPMAGGGLANPNFRRLNQIDPRFNHATAFANYGVLPGNVDPGRSYGTNFGNLSLGDLAGIMQEYGMINSGLQNTMQGYNDKLTGFGAWSPDQANIYDQSSAAFGMHDTLSNLMNNWDQLVGGYMGWNGAGRPNGGSFNAGNLPQHAPMRDARRMMLQNWLSRMYSGNGGGMTQAIGG